MAEPHRYLNILKQAFNTGANLYGSASKKQKNIQNALMGVGAFANIFKNFKKAKYQDMIDTVNMDNWIQLGKVKNNISKIKSEYDTYSPYFQQAKEKGLIIANDGDAEQLLGKKAYERAIANHDQFRSLGLSDNYPTIEHIKDREQDFAPETYETIQKLYSTELQNMISKARGLKGFDPTLIQNHVDAVGRQQIDLNLEDISILNALSNNIGKRIRKFDDSIDQYRIDNISQPIAQVKKDFDRIGGSKTLDALRENLKTMDIGINARIPKGYYEVIQNFPELTRRRIYDSVSAWADEKMSRNENGEIVNKGPTGRELEEYLQNLLKLPTNATEGARVRMDMLSNDLRSIYETHKDNPDKYYKLAKLSINTASKEMNFFNKLSEENAQKYSTTKEGYQLALKRSKDTSLSPTLRKANEDVAAMMNPANGPVVADYGEQLNIALQVRGYEDKKPSEREQLLDTWVMQDKVFRSFGYNRNVSEMAIVANDPKKLADIKKIFPSVTSDVIRGWVNTVKGNDLFYDDTKDELSNLSQTIGNFQMAASTIKSAVKPEDAQKYKDILYNKTNSVELGKVVQRVKQLSLSNNKTEILGAGTGHLTSQEILQIVTPELLDQFEIQNDEYVLARGEIFPGKELQNFVRGKIKINNLISEKYSDENVGIRLAPDEDGEMVAYADENIKKMLKDYDGDPSSTLKLLNDRNELLFQPYEASGNILAYTELRDSWANDLEKLPYLKKYGITLNRNMEDEENYNLFEQKYKTTKDIRLYSKLVDITEEVKDAKKIYDAVEKDVGKLIENKGLPTAYPRLQKKQEALENYFKFINSGKTDVKEKKELIDRLKDLRIWN